MADEVAVDTTVLQRANVALDPSRAAATRLARRLALLRRIQGKAICVLISRRLAKEYADQLKVLQNDVVSAFMELLTRPDGTHVIWNWRTPWSGGDRARARGCRFPKHDDHVLRTAIRDQPTTIYTEEEPMLRADACIYRVFRVHIREP